jgi:hypothetical protein
VHVVAAGPVNTDLKTLLVSADEKSCLALNFDKLKLKDFIKPLSDVFKSAELVSYDIKYVLKSLIQAGIEPPKPKHDLRVGAFALNSLTRDLSLAGLANKLGWEGESFDDLSPEDTVLRAGEITAAKQ